METNELIVDAVAQLGTTEKTMGEIAEFMELVVAGKSVKEDVLALRSRRPSGQVAGREPRRRSEDPSSHCRSDHPHRSPGSAAAANSVRITAELTERIQNRATIAPLSRAIARRPAAFADPLASRARPPAPPAGRPTHSNGRPRHVGGCSGTVGGPPVGPRGARNTRTDPGNMWPGPLHTPRTSRDVFRTAFRMLRGSLRRVNGAPERCGNPFACRGSSFTCRGPPLACRGVPATRCGTLFRCCGRR